MLKFNVHRSYMIASQMYFLISELYPVSAQKDDPEGKLSDSVVGK